MASLFDDTANLEDIVEIVRCMDANCPKPESNSRSLWDLRRATHIAAHHAGKETMLEKAVAMLADNGHMPGWFNQCPTASGIGDSSRNRHSNVDLVRWSETDGHARLVELKWASDSPTEAVRQILRYGAAYIYCRTHMKSLPVRRGSVMDARRVSLQVAAPVRYYADAGLPDCLSRGREGLKRFEVEGMSMSLDVLAFPDWFQRLPFSNGAEVSESCDRGELTETGRRIRDAFAGLASVYPEPGGQEQ